MRQMCKREAALKTPYWHRICVMIHDEFWGEKAKRWPTIQLVMHEAVVDLLNKVLDPMQLLV